MTSDLRASYTNYFSTTHSLLNYTLLYFTFNKNIYRVYSLIVIQNTGVGALAQTSYITFWTTHPHL